MTTSIRNTEYLNKRDGLGSDPVLNLYFRTLAVTMTYPTAETEHTTANFRELLDQIKTTGVLNLSEKKLKVGNDGLVALQTNPLTTEIDGKRVNLPVEVPREIKPDQTVVTIAAYLKKLASWFDQFQVMSRISESEPNLGELIGVQTSLNDMNIYLANHLGEQANSPDAQKLINAAKLFYATVTDARENLQSLKQTGLVEQTPVSSKSTAENTASTTIFDRAKRLPHAGIAAGITIAFMGSLIPHDAAAASAESSSVNLNSISGEVSIAGVFPNMHPAPDDGNGDQQPVATQDSSAQATPVAMTTETSPVTANQPIENTQLAAMKQQEKAPTQISQEAIQLTANFKVENIPISGGNLLLHDPAMRYSAENGYLNMANWTGGLFTYVNGKAVAVDNKDQAAVRNITTIQYGPNFMFYSKDGVTPGFDTPGLNNYARDFQDIQTLVKFLNTSAGHEVAVISIEAVQAVSLSATLLQDDKLTINGQESLIPAGTKFYAEHGQVKNDKSNIVIPGTSITKLEVFANSNSDAYLAPITIGDFLLSFAQACKAANIDPTTQKFVETSDGKIISIADLGSQINSLMVAGFNSQGDIVDYYFNGSPIAQPATQPGATATPMPTEIPTSTAVSKLNQTIPYTPVPATGYDSSTWYTQTELTAHQLKQLSPDLIDGIQTTLTDSQTQISEAVTITLQGNPYAFANATDAVSQIRLSSDLAATLRNFGAPIDGISTEYRFVYVATLDQAKAMATTMNVELDPHNGLDEQQGLGVRYGFSKTGSRLNVAFIFPGEVNQTLKNDIHNQANPTQMKVDLATDASTLLITMSRIRRDMISNPIQVVNGKTFVPEDKQVLDLLKGFPIQLMSFK